MERNGQKQLFSTGLILPNYRKKNPINPRWIYCNLFRRTKLHACIHIKLCWAIAIFAVIGVWFPPKQGTYKGVLKKQKNKLNSSCMFFLQCLIPLVCIMKRRPIWVKLCHDKGNYYVFLEARCSVLGMCSSFYSIYNVNLSSYSSSCSW